MSPSEPRRKCSCLALACARSGSRSPTGAAEPVAFGDRRTTRVATYDRAMDVSLRDLSRSNVRAICELRLAEGQQDLVAGAAFTVAEGCYEPGAVLKAVYVGEKPVGVLLVETEELAPHLARFMIDASWQQHGIGRRAVTLLAAELRDAGWQTLETSFVPVPHVTARKAFGDAAASPIPANANLRVSRSGACRYRPDGAPPRAPNEYLGCDTRTQRRTGPVGLTP